MENNKYYTPTIEEFHVGFEYEKLNPQKQWVKKQTCPYDLSSIKTSINKATLYSIASVCNGDTKLYGALCLSKSVHEVAYKRVLNNPNTYNEGIRVKYLDKEDILSLEFERLRHKNGFYDCYGLKVDDFHTIEIQFLEEQSKIRVLKESSNYFQEFPTYLFDGQIKNKSELKKLLKQLNIYE